MSRQRSMEKILASEYVSIGELVRITGCRYSTLKFYTEEGMLPFEQAEENLTRRFPREAAVAKNRTDSFSSAGRTFHSCDQKASIVTLYTIICFF